MSYPPSFGKLVNHQIHKAIDEMLSCKELHAEAAEYLKNETPRTAQFYLLPKIHKGVIPPPGRPIISANDRPTKCISQLVDHFLQDTLPFIKSYLKDTSDTIIKINKLGPLPPGCSLNTWDVNSLHTKMVNSEVIRAAELHLEEHRKVRTAPFNVSLINLLELVLTLNNFQFNGDNYLQIGGTAMGTKVAPSLANIFMADFEEKYVYTYPLQPLFWARYILMTSYVSGNMEMMHC